MTTTHNVLVVDGNTRETDEQHIARGGRPTGEHYADVLRALRSDIECVVIHPARIGNAALPNGVGLASFDGVAWTGSALNVYHDRPEVRAQIELARAVFDAGVPQFGSCWGLQVATVAAGGSVRANPRGRELGIARHITLTAFGAAHAMFDGKRAPFDAIAVHMDEVSALPAQAVVLAGNEVSAVQAAEIRYRNGIFWGTQYHPEYDFNEIATVLLRNGTHLIEAGFFVDNAVLNRFVTDLRALHADPGRKDLAWLYAFSDDVLQPMQRRAELKRWLECQVGVRTPHG